MAVIVQLSLERALVRTTDDFSKHKLQNQHIRGPTLPFFFKECHSSARGVETQSFARHAFPAFVQLRAHSTQACMHSRALRRIFFDTQAA